MKLIFSAALVGLAVLGSHVARADVTVEMVSDGEPSFMYLGSENMRMEEGGPDLPGQVVLFDGTALVVTLLDTEKETYQRIDKEMMEEMTSMVGGMMDDMMKMMEDQLASLPPEQRKIVEEQMKSAKGGMPGGMGGMMPGGDENSLAAPAESYEPTGESRKINGFNCKGHRVKKNGRQVGEVWTATLKEIGVTKDDLVIFSKFEEFAEALADMGDGDDMNFSAFNPTSNNFIGVPILSIDTEGGAKRTTEVKSITKGSVSSKKYTVPSNYTETSFMEMMEHSR